MGGVADASHGGGLEALGVRGDDDAVPGAQRRGGAPERGWPAGAERVEADRGRPVDVGLLACVAGLVVSVIVWALAHQHGNYAHATGGKTGVLVAAGGALLIGGANAIIGFFSGLGAGIR